MDYDVIEIHLEELGEHSWVKALANTLAGNYGSAQYRFVARPPVEEHTAAQHAATGATFPVMRLQDLNDLREPNAWIDTAHERLRELDHELLDAGWQRREQRGLHWWSLSYQRTG